MSTKNSASIYDQIKERLDAADLINRLGIDCVRTLNAEAYCRPLCHESSSGESLQVNLHTGVWNCKACQDSGYHGDLIQLVEYALSNGGAPTHGIAQRNADTHHAAVAWLCEQYGIVYKRGNARDDPALDAVHLFAVHAHEYLLSRPDMVEWVGKQWGFDLDTITSHAIGFVPSPMTPAIAREAVQPMSMPAFRASGIGFYRENRFVTRFEGRVIFPYLESGRAVYLIGRATPSTPTLDGGRQAPKYHKLTVNSPDRQWISERITNDHLYNERVLRNTDRVVVAEGVADAVALSALGIPVVSPVTISFNATDLERFTRKVQAQSISRVEILFDNELSGSGNHGARRAGVKLVERGLTVSILTLPLGESQRAARDEVAKILGEESFAEFERADPRRRKEIIAERVPDDDQRAWIVSQVAASKIDAAEWAAAEGAGAPGKFDKIRKDGRDVVDLLIEDEAAAVDPNDSPVDRLNAFGESIMLAAHVDETLLRGSYAGLIAKLAGKGVTKSAAQQRIAIARRDFVKPKRVDAKAKRDEAEQRETPDLILPPPDARHSRPTAPPAPEDVEPGDAKTRPTSGLSPASPTAPAPPAPPVKEEESEHDKFAPQRDSVPKNIERKVPEEIVGEFVAQLIIDSMKYTPFLTADDLYLVRGNERVQVGLSSKTSEFATLLFMISGLTAQKSSHRSYIDITVYFLRRRARRARDVAWSHVARDGSVFFPTGDSDGQLLRIAQGEVTRMRMAEAKVPAVAGPDFQPFRYIERDGGMAEIDKVFRWTSLAPSDRMVLLHWIACLPLLRKIGTIPIVRIEGGSSSGKSRAVDAISYLVNGGESSSVPTAPALISQLASEMLTIDDNREVDGIDKNFLGTMLQATQLGARSKRKRDTDTGTVVERVSGALLMNGVEPIHSGKSEVASRMLVMRCEPVHRAPGSPSANEVLFEHVLAARDGFWSEAVRRCAIALQFDAEHGEKIGAQIEEVFGSTRIGRLSSYLRVMYFVAVAGLPDGLRPAALDHVLPTWVEAFESLGDYALDSLVREELAVSAVRYALDYARATAETPYPNSPQRQGCNGKYFADIEKGDEVLGMMTAPQLARLVRTAGKELNAPRAVTSDLRAGQLEARILDGLGFLEAAGIQVIQKATKKGKMRFAFYREIEAPKSWGGKVESATSGADWGDGGGESWTDPDAPAVLAQ